jgi:excisionase family DNA binding protein
VLDRHSRGDTPWSSLDLLGKISGRSMAYVGMSTATNERTICLTYNVETAARLLGISRALAYQLVRAGDLPSVKLGRRVLIPQRAITELLDASTLAPRERRST